MCCLLLAVGVFAMAICLAGPARAQEEIPVRITSDKLSYDATGQNVRFLGKVHVTHPDAQLWADSITVVLSSSGNSGKKKEEAPAMDAGQIERIIAEGSVRVTMQDGKNGSCAKATYDLTTGILVMEGQPILRDGENSIQGHTINFYVKENKSEVLGSSDKPVEAIFTAPKRFN
ncbi:hypothetical protein DSM19430T_01260 [Desulfovibrio psychrotolerans]|uniref:Organic solvent tolerance-like N-terminal domain-containing protein n=2 Tax=Desulfovibrio psychrotolerans TaxID=415242 RepID=A0A7J0BQI5_9BACT|nr:hypothetical protein DSM19430T_01260 [Desulfovibrio psychrotolerans]